MATQESIRKGQTVRVVGLAGTCKVVDVYCAPGERGNRVKVYYPKARPHKRYATVYEKDCVPVE